MKRVSPEGSRAGATLMNVTAKKRLLEEASGWTEAQAEAALRVARSHADLAAYLEDEAELSANTLRARDDAWARASARDAIQEERW